MKISRAVLHGAAIVTACGTLLAPPVHAQEGAGQGVEGTTVGRPRPETYGGADTTNYVLQAYAFDPWSGDGASFLGNSFGSRGCSSPCLFEAPVMLPNGARIEAMELEACDSDPAATVTVRLFRQGNLESAIPILATVSTGGTPGCNFFAVALPAPHTVDNLLNSYFVEVFINGSTINTRFQAVRLEYRLQISPPPATATFPNDVPVGHPLFRFVEALAASGITGGCGPGSYCPNNPLTRGQMAVFIATALGLHFPN